MRIVGIDLSMSCTGVATDDTEWGVIRTVPPKTTGDVKRKRAFGRAADPRRISEVVDKLDVAWRAFDADLVVLEGYPGGAAGSTHSLRELGGAVRLHCARMGTPWMEVSPMTLKKYATGSGAADKLQVGLAAARRLGYTGDNDNEADALWLRQIGMALMEAPGVVPMPKDHMVALESLWPWLDVITEMSA